MEQGTTTETLYQSGNRSGQNGNMNITEFLLARIAEDEERAARWFTSWRDGGGVIDLTLTPGPSRVIAECEAKRRIVERAQYIEDFEYSESFTIAGLEYDEHILPILAAVYADHADFREEWKA